MEEAVARVWIDIAMLFAALSAVIVSVRANTVAHRSAKDRAVLELVGSLTSGEVLKGQARVDEFVRSNRVKRHNEGWAKQRRGHGRVGQYAEDAAWQSVADGYYALLRAIVYGAIVYENTRDRGLVPWLGTKRRRLWAWVLERRGVEHSWKAAALRSSAGRAWRRHERQLRDLLRDLASSGRVRWSV